MGVFFILQVIYELGEPWWSDVDLPPLKIHRPLPGLNARSWSTMASAITTRPPNRALWQYYHQSYLAASRRNGRRE
jgi:hypothetical protein